MADEMPDFVNLDSINGVRPPSRFTIASSDLAELRKRHFLLQRQRQDECGDLLAKADELRWLARDAGQWIESLADRDVVQGIIDYWTSVIGSLPGQAFPQLIDLCRFDPACREIYQNHAEEVFAQLREQGHEDLTTDILIAADPRWTEHLPAILLAGRRELLQSPLAGEVREILVAEGLLRPDEDGNGTLGDQGVTVGTFTLRHRNLLEGSGKLALAEGEAEVIFSKRKRLDLAADYWAKRSGTKSDLLLRGTALREALKIGKPGEPLRSYIDASKAARNRRWILSGGAALSISFAILLAIPAFKAWIESLNYFAVKNAVNAASTSQGDISNQVVNSEDISPIQDPTQSRTGAMWIGSSTLPLLAAAGDQLVDPATIGPFPGNLRYRALVDIWLRNGPPDPEGYISKPTIAVVPQGSQVEILKVYSPYMRNGIGQYWARVRRVYTLYVHYPKPPIGDVAALLSAPDDTDIDRFDVMQPQQIANAAQLYDVRYNSPYDLRAARALMEHLLAVAPPRDGISPRCIQISGGRAGTIEIWIDPTVTVARGHARAAMPDSCNPSETVAQAAVAAE